MKIVLDPYLIGLIIMFIGVGVIIIGILYIMYSSIKSGSGKVEGGGVIVIGPIPIVFGSGEKITKLLIILAIILFVIVLAIEFIPIYLYKNMFSYLVSRWM